MYDTVQELQTLKEKNEALETKLREINLTLTNVVKAYPKVSSLLHIYHNSSVNASTGATSEKSTAAGGIKGVHDTEGNSALPCGLFICLYAWRKYR